MVGSSYVGQCMAMETRSTSIPLVLLIFLYKYFQITNSAKLKRLKKKQLRQIEKR